MYIQYITGTSSLYITLVYVYSTITHTWKQYDYTCTCKLAFQENTHSAKIITASMLTFRRNNHCDLSKDQLKPKHRNYINILLNSKHGDCIHAQLKPKHCDDINVYLKPKHCDYINVHWKPKHRGYFTFRLNL